MANRNLTVGASVPGTSSTHKASFKERPYGGHIASNESQRGAHLYAPAPLFSIVFPVILFRLILLNFTLNKMTGDRLIKCSRYRARMKGAFKVSVSYSCE